MINYDLRRQISFSNYLMRLLSGFVVRQFHSNRVLLNVNELDQREVPATFRWHPDAGSAIWWRVENWDEFAFGNWVDALRVPGGLGAIEDAVQFGDYDALCIVNSSATVNSVTITSGFKSELVLQTSLTIAGIGEGSIITLDSAGASTGSPHYEPVTA